jgi:gag-polyprotein putative aspartyl protease
MLRAAFAFVFLPCILLAGFALSVNAETIALRHAEGTLLVPVRINGKITLDFTLDSGASDVSIPADVVSTLVRTGTITGADLLGTYHYQLADGSTGTTRKIRLRSLRIGRTEIRDVIASIAPAEGPLLLGQSFLSRLPSWAIDNKRNLLIIGTASEPAEQASTAGLREPTEEAPAATTSEPNEGGPVTTTSEPAEEAPVASASQPVEETPIAGSLAQQVASMQNVFWRSCGSDPTGEPVSVCGPLSNLVAKAQLLLDQVRNGALSPQDAEQQLQAARAESSASGDFADEVEQIRGVFWKSCGSDPTADPISVCGPLSALVGKARALLNQVQAGELSPQDAEQQLKAARDQAGQSP